MFARADRPFFAGGFPTLIGMSLTFALGVTLAAVGSGWGRRGLIVLVDWLSLDFA